MTILVMVVIGLFLWLLRETKWLTIRLSGNPLPPQESELVVKAEATVRPQLRGVAEATVRPQLWRITETVAQLRKSWAMEIIIYLAAIVAAEMITVFLQPLGGIITHVAILVTVIIRSAHTTDKLQRQLVLSLALAPLVRIISLSMPLTNVPQLWWYPIMYGPLFVAAIVVMRALGFSREDVGLSFRASSIPLQIAVVASGFGFGVAEYLILRPEAWIAEFTWVGMLRPALVLLVTTGFVEELIFRGVLQRSAWERWGWRGLIYVSALFAILHIGFLSWVDVLFVFGVAMYFAWVVKRTRSLLAVTLAHGLTNATLYLIAPFLF